MCRAPHWECSKTPPPPLLCLLQVSYSVSISRTCTGGLLDQPSYTLWYWATDVYGKSSPAVAASVVLQ